MKKLMTRGNAKLSKKILCWSITPVKSCLNCAQCKDDCYAMKAYNQYPAVKIAWDRNLALAKSGDFGEYIVKQLSAARTCEMVRIHVAGDFFSKQYIDNWYQIVSLFPDIQFYTYTKVWDRFELELSNLDYFDNCNVINSIAPDGGVNFGNQDRVNELKAMGYSVCPAGYQPITCGEQCTNCMTEKDICFLVH